MSIRKRDDSVKPGRGIDGTLGENFTKRSGDPWDSNPKGNRNTGAEKAAYTDNSPPLRNKMPDDQSGGAGSKN